MHRDDLITGNIDWATVGLYFFMVLWGWLNIYSATFDESNSLFDPQFNTGRQLIFIVVAAILIIAILVIDVRFYETFAFIIYGIIIFILLLMPVIGKEVGGNKSWLGFGSFGIQPSEFAKFATALAVAKIIGTIGFRMENFRSQITLLLLVLVPVALIILQKDFGTAMVFTIFIVVYYREGMSPLLLLIGLGTAAIFIITLLVNNQLILFGTIGAIWILLIILNRKKKFKRILFISTITFALAATIFSVDFIFNNILKEHHQKRVRVLINPELDRLGAGYHVYQSKVAIGSGGLIGKGYLKGKMTKGEFVPAQYTDFIFCTIGEEQGWIGSLVLVATFVVFLLRIIFLAERQKSRFARVYGYSVAMIFFFHFATNIAMTIGLFPVIGIPLPFFSYGGSSLLGFTMLLFILLKLDANRMNMLQRL